MKFTSFMKKIFIFNVVISVLNKYVKRESCDFSFFIYSLKTKGFNNANFNSSDEYTGDTSGIDGEGGENVKAPFTNAAEDKTRSTIGCISGAAVWRCSGNKIINISQLNATITNFFSSALAEAIGKKPDKGKHQDDKQKENEAVKSRRIPIVHTSIDDIKEYAYVKGKLKLIYVRSFYDNDGDDSNLKELYEAKFQFYKDRVIYVTTFALVKNSLSNNINQTEKWLNASMKVLQKNYYKISARCNPAIETFYGSISFSEEELKQFEALRKALKRNVNITHDNLFSNLDIFKSAKRKYLEYMNYSSVDPSFMSTVDAKDGHSDVTDSFHVEQDLLKSLNPFDKIKYVSHGRVKNSHKIVCTLEKDFKKVEDRFILYNLIRDNIIESEETTEVIIFETSKNGIFTYDAKHSKEINLISKNFEIEIMMDSNAFLNEHDKYFYLNKYNSVHLELQNKGIIKYDFIYSWLSTYFIDSHKHKFFYPCFYVSTQYDVFDSGLYGVNFYTPQYHTLSEQVQSSSPHLDSWKKEVDSNVPNEEVSQGGTTKSIQNDNSFSFLELKTTLHNENVGRGSHGNKSGYHRNSGMEGDSNQGNSAKDAHMNPNNMGSRGAERDKGEEKNTYDPSHVRMVPPANKQGVNVMGSKMNAQIGKTRTDVPRKNINAKKATARKGPNNKAATNDSSNSYLDNVFGYVNKIKNVICGDEENASTSHTSHKMSDKREKSKMPQQGKSTRKNSIRDNFTPDDAIIPWIEPFNEDIQKMKAMYISKEKPPPLEQQAKKAFPSMEEPNKYSKEPATDQPIPPVPNMHHEIISSEPKHAPTFDTIHVKDIEDYTEKKSNEHFAQNPKEPNEEKYDKNGEDNFEKKTEEHFGENAEDSFGNKMETQLQETLLQQVEEESFEKKKEYMSKLSEDHKYDSLIPFLYKTFHDKALLSGDFLKSDHYDRDDSDKLSVQRNSSDDSNEDFVHSYYQFPSLREGSKTFASNLSGDSSDADNTHVRDVDENLKDKIYEQNDYFPRYKYILEEHPSRIIVGLLQDDTETAFIVDWLYGDNILCVLRSKFYKELYYNMVRKNYLKVLNNFKFGNDKELTTMSSDTKGVTMSANFYPHFSAIKFFFNDKSSDNFENELKSYMLIIHYLLNSYSSPCKDYKNVKYFYSDDTFNVTHLNFISDKLLALISECALETMNWDIPIGIIRKNENGINRTIFSRTLKDVRRSVHDYALKFRTIKGKDAVQFAMSNYTTVADDYNVKYDIFLNVISRLFYLHAVGLVHGNIKADNFVVQENEEDDKHVKVLLRSFNDVVEEGGYGNFKGSAIYAAPEKLKSYFNTITYNLKSDAFSLGLSLATIFTKKEFFLQKLERKLTYPVDKYILSLVRRNPMVLLWIKSINPFLRKRLSIYKFRSYLKVSVEELERRLSEKSVYKWFDDKFQFINYEEEEKLHDLFTKAEGRNVSGLSKNSSEMNTEQKQNDLESCFFRYTHASNTEKGGDMNTPKDSYSLHIFKGESSSIGKNEGVSFYQFPVGVNRTSASIRGRDYSDGDSDGSGGKTDQSTKHYFSSIFKHDFWQSPIQRNKKFRKRKKDGRENIYKIPFDRNFEHQVDFSSIDAHNRKNYINACYSFKNEVVGTAMKTLSIEHEAYRADLFDMYLLNKDKLLYLVDRDDNVKHLMYVLQGFPTPDCRGILNERIYDKWYSVRKMVLLKALLFYGYFSLHERLSYEFKLYELQNFPLSEDNSDTFETVVRRCIEREHFNEFSNLLLAQYVYDNYHQGNQYMSIFINFYAVNETVYAMDTNAINNLMKPYIKQSFSIINFDNAENFLHYMKRKELYKDMDQVDRVPIKIDKSNYTDLYEQKVPLINSFVIKIDKFVIKDMSINLAVLLNNAFWGMKNKCKCVNYTHLHVRTGGSDFPQGHISGNQMIDLHKPLGTVLREIIPDIFDKQNNPNDLLSWRTFKPSNIHLHVVLRNSLHFIDRSTLISCSKKLSKVAPVYFPNFTNSHKSEIMKIKVGLGSSKYFYLSFNISLLRSNEITLKNVIYFIYKNYKSQLEKNVMYRNVGGKNRSAKFNCLAMSEDNTFFYNNVTGNLIKETSLNRVISALYNVDLMEPSYVIKAALNYYNNRGNNCILLRLVTVCNSVRERRKASNGKESEFVLEHSAGVYSDAAEGIEAEGTKVERIEAEGTKVEKADTERIEAEGTKVEKAEVDSTDAASTNGTNAHAERTDEEHTHHEAEGLEKTTDEHTDVEPKNSEPATDQHTPDEITIVEMPPDETTNANPPNDEPPVVLSQNESSFLQRQKHVIKAIDKDGAYHYGTVECLHFLHKQVINFFHESNITNAFDQITIPSEYTYINKKNKLRNGKFEYSTKTINFNIISNVMNLQRYDKELYTLVDFMNLIIQWLVEQGSFDIKNKCNFLSCSSNSPQFGMVLSITTQGRVKHVLYKNDESLMKFLFYNILKDHQSKRYSPELIASAIKLYNLKVTFFLMDEIGHIFPDLQSLSNPPEQTTPLPPFKDCLKQLNGKNVTLYGDEANQGMYVSFILKFLNKNIMYRISKHEFYKIIYDFNGNEVTKDEGENLQNPVLSSIPEIEDKFRYVFLSELSYYVNIPTELKKRNKAVSVTMNPKYYELLSQKCYLDEQNCFYAVEEIISNVNGTFIEPVFVVKNVMNFFLRRKIRAVLSRVKNTIIS
ncbi:serine/threonine protein kinase [Plasmodium fragile]|uniref:Serine/threonine protein kinase n=1 Tax=Plasmodium fragile TaxID=5857 RepID=A0A0D9QMB1_PLAFR|nr:serine/threonine protein kinase [Plasmodium fragile]KJP88164.1 serine/threonine protein kinase [Plasmodium fragile]